MVDCIVRTVREEGALSLWRGNGTSVLRYYPSVALNFSLKDLYKSMLRNGETSMASRLASAATANFIAGAAAGCTTLILIYPLDIAHTRLAADIGKSDSRQFRGIVHFLRTIHRTDGVAGIYRGLPASLHGMVVHRGLYFGGFDTAKEFLVPESSALWKRWTAAQFVTTAAGLISYPLDTVRRRMMMQSGMERRMYGSTLDCWRKIYKMEGFVSFYRGAVSNMFRSTGAAAILVLYDEDNNNKYKGFKIAEDMFWKDGQHFQIIGGDLHYFRVLPEYWEDRLLRAKALGLNTIQTYVPWNLHEPSPKKWVFDGIANVESFLNLAQELGFLVMLRAGPYICAEWDLGGFPAWLLAIEPALKLRSSDPAYLNLVERWWGILLPKIAPFLYENGGPIIMVQIENEFGSFGDDKAYLRYLAVLARRHLGNDIILFTTDGGTNNTLKNGTIPEEGVYAAVDFSTGENPWPLFELQKKYNAPGKSPPLSSEFYTGWLTHWGEPNAKTNASYTATFLQKILSCNGSVVLYMAHGGTNFGFFNGANTGQNSTEYKADLTSYDYDAPIKESGDVDNPKFIALRNVIKKYSPKPLPPIPSSIERAKYEMVKVTKVASLFNILDILCSYKDIVEADQPIAMELVGQMYGFLLYVSQYSGKESHCTLSVPKVHDRAQVFVSCVTEGVEGSPMFVGVIERWSNEEALIPMFECSSNISLFILVENMGRVNYGPYIYDRKGILSSVSLDGNILHGWKMYPISFDKISLANETLIGRLAASEYVNNSIQTSLKFQSGSILELPAFYEAHYFIDQNDPIKDTFISFRGWNKGVVFVNSFNIGRFWPFLGPQCTLYVPAPILRHGKNVVIIFELHSPNPDLTIEFVQQPDFSCGQIKQ